MKTRQCFVSNSSSSSFVIHKSEFKSKENFNNILKDLEQFESQSDSAWGDSNNTFEYDGAYLYLETRYVFHNICDIFTKNDEDLSTINAYKEFDY